MMQLSQYITHSFIHKLINGLFILSTISNLFGQQAEIDSLKNQLNITKHDTLRIHDYAGIWRNYMSVNLDSAYTYAIQGLTFSEEKELPNGIADFAVYAAFIKSQNGFKNEALSIMTEKLKLLEDQYDYLQGELFLVQWIAETYREHNQTDSALFYFEKMYANTKGVRPQFEVAANVGIAQVYQQERLFRPALQYYQIADSICQANNINTNTCTTCITNTGGILSEIGDYVNANKYFERAQKEYTSRNEEFLLNELNYMRAFALYNLDRYEEATSLTELGIDFFTRQNALIKLCSGYETLILIKNKLKDYKAVKIAADNYSDIAHQLNDSVHIVKSFIELSNIEISLGQPLKAIQHLTDISDYIKESEDKFINQKYYKILSGAYNKLGLWEQAYDTHIQHFNYTTQILNELDANTVKELEISYDIKNKEQRIELLNAENELARQREVNRNNIMIVGFTLFGLLLAGLLYYSRLKQQTNNRLRELDKIKSRFFANISHELRTPLTLIKNPLELLSADVQLDPRNQSRIQNALQNTSKLKQLVDDLLDLTKIQTGNYNLAIYQFDNEHHLSMLLSNFESLKFEKDQEYIYNLNIASFPIYYDPLIVSTICSNLLANAFKYSSIGSTIEANICGKEDFIEITIADDGPGITNADKEFIFDRFYQGTSINGEQSGLGIGLSLVKELVSAHYGAIKLDSASENGARFVVTLPVNRSLFTTKNGNIQDRPYLHFSENGANLKVDEGFVFQENNDTEVPILLIVEDNNDMRLHLKDLFVDNYKILEAENGKVGLEKTLEYVPDLIISDMMMPVMNGDEMCDQIKQDPRISHIPIIVLTAKAAEKTKLATLRIGVEDYISKPFNNEELQLKVRNLLEQRERLRAVFETDIQPKPSEVSMNTSDIRFWEELEKVLQKNFDDSGFSINDFSREMLMSRMQLHRKLKALSNQSASVYLRNYRLKKATELMKTTDLTVSEIAYDVGFSSPFYFSKCFKEFYGVTPSLYTI